MTCILYCTSHHNLCIHRRHLSNFVIFASGVLIFASEYSERPPPPHEENELPASGYGQSWLARTSVIGPVTRRSFQPRPAT
eukprot:6178530-Pleurochrysis_carterae.AAC.2